MARSGLLAKKKEGIRHCVNNKFGPKNKKRGEFVNTLLRYRVSV